MTNTGIKKAQEKLKEYRDKGMTISVENNLIVKANKHPSTM